MAFQDICGKYTDNLEIDHINCVRNDNRAINLRWVTKSQNQLNPITRQHHSDALKGKNYGLVGERCYWFGKFGKDNPKSKPIIQLDLEGNFLAEFEGLADVERKLGIGHANICRVLKDKQKTAGGFKWAYKQ